VTIDDARYLNLATFRRNGVAVETPIWFAEADGKLYAFSAGDAGKVKRLRHSARARIAACDVRGHVLGPWLDAHAVLVTEPARIQRAYTALRAKYGWQMRMTDWLSTLSGRIGHRVVLEITPA